MVRHYCNCGAIGLIGFLVLLPVVKVYKSESGNVSRVRNFNNWRSKDLASKYLIQLTSLFLVILEWFWHYNQWDKRMILFYWIHAFLKKFNKTESKLIFEMSLASLKQPTEKRKRNLKRLQETVQSWIQQLINDVVFYVHVPNGLCGVTGVTA